LPELLTSLAGVAAQARTEAITQDAAKAQSQRKKGAKFLIWPLLITRNGSKKSPVS
jgi:hypothetical protein